MGTPATWMLRGSVCGWAVAVKSVLQNNMNVNIFFIALQSYY